MMIPVMLKDGTDRNVFPQVLDHLLESEQVMLFKRGGNWVVVGRDPVRGMGEGDYDGPERRSHLTRGFH